MKTWTTLIVATSIVVISACSRKSGMEAQAPAAPPASTALSPEEAATARTAIVTWLECEECEAGELEAVVKLGNTAVPTLGATLQQGPSPASREKLRRHLEESYRKLVEYSRTHTEGKMEMSEEQYVKMYMDNFVANYGVRSAQALAAIGGPEARKQLEAAKKAELREDVRAVVVESEKKLK